MLSNDNSVKISAATTLTSPSVAITAVVLSMLAASPDYDRLYKDFDNPLRGLYEISRCADQAPTMEYLLKERANELYAKLCAKIDKYVELSDGWNGYDAFPIPERTITIAKQFLQNMLANHIDLEGWEVFPTGRESIQFEKTLLETYVEVEVFSDGNFAFYFDGRDEIELDSIKLEETLQRVSSVFA